MPLEVEVASKSERSALVIASMVTMASYETPLTVTTSSYTQVPPVVVVGLAVSGDPKSSDCPPVGMDCENTCPDHKSKAGIKREK